MDTLTVKEYAEKRGVTDRAVRQYMAEGLIPKKAQVRKGQRVYIDAKKADAALAEHATTRRQILGAKATPQQKEETTQKAGTAGLSYFDARTLAQRYKAALLKIELDEKTGRLVEAEAVKAAAFGKARAVRDALLNVPDRIAPILAAEEDPQRISEIMTTELKTALEELAR